ADAFVQRRHGNLFVDEERGGIGKGPRRRATGIPPDLAARGIGRLGGNAGKLETASVDPPRMPVIAPQYERPLCFNLVDVLRRRREAIVIELDGFEPVVGTTLVLGKALLDSRSQRFNGGLDAGEAAFRPIYSADDRMDVGVDKSGQHQLALEVDHRGGSANQRRDLVILANGDNGVALDGDRLPDRARRIGRVDLAIPKYHIRHLNGPAIGKPETENDADDNG